MCITQRRRSPSPSVLAGGIVLVLTAAVMSESPAARGDDGYYATSVRNLDFTAGFLPQPNDSGQRRTRRMHPYYPYAALDGEGEAYVVAAQDADAPEWFPDLDTVLAVHAEQGRPAVGTLFWPKADGSGMKRLRFRIHEHQLSSDDRDFLEAKARHFQRLANDDRPGAAWFRHQLRETNRALGRSPSAGLAARQRVFRTRGTTMEETYALLSGGRALSENLQLERMLPEAQASRATVPLESIEGITVAEFDWDAMLSSEATPLDPLAKYIPDDQHVIFFPDFDSMVRVVDNATEQGAAILNLAEPRAEHARTQDRYERQLGLSLHAGARLLGGRIIRSVAFTGSDPYLRTGSDVAVVFEAVNPQALERLVVAHVTTSTAVIDGVRRRSDQVGGVNFTRFRSPGREVCSYIGALGSAVVVSNSPAQLRQLVDAFHSKRPSIASLDEYRFFRQRYALEDDGEDAFLFVSDKTIRRWCGPRWRIATSRRARALAVMTEVQARYLPRLVAGDVPNGHVTSPELTRVAGPLHFSAGGVVSDTYGSMEFLTPIAELDFTRVTPEEARLYRQWREGYQNNWSRYFDPIAMRLRASDDRVSADLTVMPLIARSDYNRFIELSRNATLESGEGDPHEGTLLHLALAVNTESPMIRQWSLWLEGLTSEFRIALLDWLGDTVAVYLDEGEFWSDQAGSDHEDFRRFLARDGARMPIAAWFEVQNSLKLAAFLAVLPGAVEQNWPGMTRWQLVPHGGLLYVQVSPTQRGRDQLPEWCRDASLYYVVLEGGLLVTLNRELLHRAIDRRHARASVALGEEEDAPLAYPWLGENLAVHVSRDFAEAAGILFEDDYQQQMRILCWKNLAILNAWKATFPDEDPVRLHERFWQVRLVCPGGGIYRWNEEWQTMESTVFGHPGVPLEGSPWPESLRGLESADFGLTFEENGLRARIELSRE